MSRLADKSVDVRIKLAAALLNVLLRPLPNRHGTLGFAFVVDHIDQEAIDRHRVGPENNLLREERKAWRLGERATMPDSPQPIHYVQHRLRPQRLHRRQG